VPHSEPVTNPTGGAGLGRVGTQPALGPFWMEQIADPDNLQRAWQRVKANQGAPGVDRMTLEEAGIWLHTHGAALRQSLLDGTYQPLPLRRQAIPKPGGGERLLGIPAVLDRLVQQAIAQVLTPIFDPGFSASSFGFRPGRSAHQALRQVQGFLQAGYRTAVDLDLEKFFDRVHHDVLMPYMAYVKTLSPPPVRPGDHELEVVFCVRGALSPLLANILLDELDQELERRGLRFARYADDLLILVKTERAGQRVKASLTRYLTRVLRLTVNEAKSRVAPAAQCVFLGFTFYRGHKLRWSDQAFADFRHRLKRLTGRSWGVSMAYRLRKLSEYVRGWMGYFGISDYYNPVVEVDHWLRRRVRMCYWKQWRYARTKVRHLLALGTSKKQAIFTAISRKSYWHLSKTLATQSGMTNQWLGQQGLLSIRDLWMQAHGYA